MIKPFFIWLVLPLCSVAVITDLVTASGADPALTAEFSSGVQQAVAQTAELSIRARFRYQHEFVSLSEETAKKLADAGREPRMSSVQTFDCALLGPHALRHITPSSGLELFEVTNEQYAFGVQKPQDSDQFSLQFVERHGASELTDQMIAEKEHLARAVVLSAYHFFGIPLGTAIDSSEFEIHDAFAVDTASGRLVRVEFDYLSHDPAGAPDQTCTDCFIVCDPQKQWALAEYGGTVHTEINGATALHQVNLELSQSSAGIPIATKVVSITDSVDDPGTVSRSISTLEILDTEVKDDEFYLTFYGLPEPTFQERSIWGAWLWYVLAGAACIVVFVFVRRRQKSAA